MAVITLAADSTTLTLNGTIINDLIAGDFMDLAPENDRTAHVNSRNGGVNIQERTDGGVHMLTVRVQRYSDSDIFLSTANNQAGVTLFNGSAKTNFNRNGIDGVETYSLEDGSITTQPTATYNDQDGNAVMEYVVKFRNVIRNL